MNIQYILYFYEMRFFNIILLVFLSSALVFSQNSSEGFILEDGDDEQSSVVKKEDSKKKKIFTNIAIGTSVMSSGNNGSAFNTYVNPTVSYQFTPKLSVSMGLMAVQSNFNNYSYYNYYEGQIENTSFSGVSAYYTLQASYQLSEKIRVYGGIMLGDQSIDFAGTNIPTDPQNNRAPMAYRAGFEYKIGKNATLQFEFQFREANSIQDMQMQSVNGFGMMRNSSMFGPSMYGW